VARRLALSAIAVSSSAGDPTLKATGATGGATGLITDLRRVTTRELTETLGEDRLRELRAEGEAMDSDRAVAHALNLIDRVLAST
jgi:hypothetical protein